MIKKILKKMQSLNKEYLLLAAVAVVLVFLVYSTKAVSQQPPEEIVLATFYPAPFGQFNELSSKLYRDYDNPTHRFADPAGLSILSELRVTARLVTGYIAGPGTLVDRYSVNFGTGGAGNGDAKLNIVYSRAMHMQDPGPGTRRQGGKYVYDIAEGVYGKDCEAGDVVLISDKEDEDVMRSAASFSLRIAGVISEDPKIYMGAHKNKVPLALAGIVKCKASAENGSIKKGDLLVSAALPGHAMKAAPQEVKPGMILGKAMEPLKENTGKILILVNKQ